MGRRSDGGREGVEGALATSLRGDGDIRTSEGLASSAVIGGSVSAGAGCARERCQRPLPVEISFANEGAGWGKVSHN
jgi:hypothetical protein